MRAGQRARLSAVPASLAAALRLALGVAHQGEGQAIAQREIVASPQKALDARRQRIVVSGSRINAVKWVGLMSLAALTLFAIAPVHSGNRLTAATAIGVYAAAVAVVVVMLASQDRPLTGQLGLDPDVPDQVSPPSGERLGARLAEARLSVPTPERGWKARSRS